MECEDSDHEEWSSEDEEYWREPSETEDELPDDLMDEHGEGSGQHEEDEYIINFPLVFENL